MDAGDWAEIKKFEPLEKSTFIWDMMAELGYDVVTPGPRELSYGLDTLQKLLDKHPEIQVVSANITDKAGNLIWKPYTIINRADTRIAVVGVTGSAPYTFNLTRGLQESDDFAFLETKDVLQKVIPDLKSQADLVVVLLHETPADARRIIDEVPGMDVVIVGHSPGYSFNPDRLASTLMVRGGNKGQYLSVLDLILDNNNAILDYNGESKPLGKAVIKEPDIEKTVDAFQKDYEQREKAAKRKEAIGQALDEGNEIFVGAETCARCHAEEYSSWLASAHGTADRPEPLAVDSYAHEGTDVSGVQCEHCHGLGTFHGTTGMVTVVPEETCRSCHITEGAPDFDYAQALKETIHH